MTHEEELIRKDRMRYTKNTLSANLVIAAIVFNVLYFVSIYQSDVGSFYYTILIGGSIIYNLVFLLVAFLASEGVKSRKGGFTGILLVMGVMQIVRMFILPAKAHSAVVTVNSVDIPVMGDAQYTRLLIYLALSAVCCIAAAITSFIQNRMLVQYLQSLENTPA